MIINVGRSPCGERGLKSSQSANPSGMFASLPMRGAWIEITGMPDLRNRQAVAPHAGSVD